MLFNVFVACPSLLMAALSIITLTLDKLFPFTTEANGGVITIVGDGLMLNNELL